MTAECRLLEAKNSVARKDMQVSKSPERPPIALAVHPLVSGHKTVSAINQYRESLQERDILTQLISEELTLLTPVSRNPRQCTR
jgi:hypothetical protein